MVNIGNISILVLILVCRTEGDEKFLTGKFPEGFRWGIRGYEIYPHKCKYSHFIRLRYIMIFCSNHK